MDLQIKTKRALRLNDSLEYYRQKNDSISLSSPPQDCQSSLVIEEEFSSDEGEDEDDDGDFPAHFSQFPPRSFQDFRNEDFDDEDDVEFADDDDDGIQFTNSDDEDIRFVNSDVEFDEDIVIEDREEGDRRTFVDIPFWFGYEDDDQIRCILAKYAATLKLDDEIKRCIRMPPPFIGRVKRSVVHSESSFMTLDEVEIFRRSTLPPFSQLPFVKKHVLLSVWSIDDGVQSSCRAITKKEIRGGDFEFSSEVRSEIDDILAEMENSNEYEFAKQGKDSKAANVSPKLGHSTQGRNENNDSGATPREISYLLAYPNYGKIGFQYEESHTSKEVTSPKTNGNNSNFYGKFIPPELLHSTKPDDDS